MKEYVAGFLFDTTRERVVLIEKKKPPWQAGLHNAVGGKIKTGEQPRDAMVREFREETGLSVYDWSEFCFLHHTKDEWGVRFFMGIGAVNEIKQMEDEKPDVFNIHSLPPTVISHLHWLIPLALDEDGVYADILDPTS